VGVVVLEVLLQYYGEVAWSGDQQVVEAFAAQGADEAFRDGVGSRCSNWGADDADVGAGEHGVEGGGELAVSVADQKPKPAGLVAEIDEEVAGLLGDPVPGGVGGDPGEVHPAGAVLDHDEQVEASEEDGVDVGEVDREDRVGLRGQELFPGRAGPLGSGVNASGLKDLPDSGGGDLVAESDELTVDASVAPGRVLAGHPQYQGTDPGAGWVSGPVGVAGESTGGRRGGRASAAGSSARQAGAGEAAWAAVC
jgi:hypothetical protein